MKPAGFLRYSYYKAVRGIWIRRTEPVRSPHDKTLDRRMKRSERQSFRIYLDRCLADQRSSV